MKKYIYPSQSHGLLRGTIQESKFLHVLTLFKVTMSGKIHKVIQPQNHSTTERMNIALAQCLTRGLRGSRPDPWPLWMGTYSIMVHKWDFPAREVKFVEGVFWIHWDGQNHWFHHSESLCYKCAPTGYPQCNLGSIMAGNGLDHVRHPKSLIPSICVLLSLW